MCRINHTIVSDVTIRTLSGGNIMKLEELKSGEDYNKEILKLIQKLNISEENVELYKTGFHDMKRERDLLKEDIELLKKNQKAREEVIKKLKEELRMYTQCNDELGRVNKLKDKQIKDLKFKNAALRLQADEYFEFWQEAIKK